MNKIWYIIAVITLLIIFKDDLPEPIMQVVEQTQMVLLGVLVIFILFFTAPVWVTLTASVIILGITLYNTDIINTKAITGNNSNTDIVNTKAITDTNSNIMKDDCSKNNDPCCGWVGLCIHVTGHADK